MASAFKNHAARMAGGVKQFKPSFPEKLKGGRIEKIADYFNMIFQDYKTVVVETIQDIKKYPMKSSIYISTLAGLGLLYKTNPSETSFRTRLIHSSQDLLLVGEPIRNPTSDNHIQDLALTLKDGKLRFTSLGILTLVWRTQHSHWSGLYDAQCKQLKPQWSEFHKHVVDVGVLGKWIYLDKAMIDYDINPEEWDEDGRSKHV
ncbi:mitochondrial import inner membrane translocase subunit Tim29-like [Haliotis rubra]|uniref:mitochondrial import inner membrane translocase subunit Tim29-like n=1 Tax=Haliotis rubra TaxID=36100 RepID=UPI001EE61456|nr:mitochondrial import inner membrane translocase subunit Tim29-like [Haliotis rubra]